MCNRDIGSEFVFEAAGTMPIAMSADGFVILFAAEAPTIVAFALGFAFAPTIEGEGEPDDCRPDEAPFKPFKTRPGGMDEEAGEGNIPTRDMPDELGEVVPEKPGGKERLVEGANFHVCPCVFPPRVAEPEQSVDAVLLLEEEKGTEDMERPGGEVEFKPLRLLLLPVLCRAEMPVVGDGADVGMRKDCKLLRGCCCTKGF